VICQPILFHNQSQQISKKYCHPVGDRRDFAFLINRNPEKAELPPCRTPPVVPSVVLEEAVMRHKIVVLAVLLLVVAIDSISLEADGPVAGDPAAATAPKAKAATPARLRSPIDGQEITGPVDPNFAEYVYQQGLLALGKNDRAWAAELMRFYAQTGSNPRQVAKALQFVAAQQNGN
jgi:hypothetical protein